MDLTVGFLKKPATKPTNAKAIKNIENENDDNATNNPVTVVPTNAPKISEKPCPNVRAPALKKPTTMTIVAPLD